VAVGNGHGRLSDAQKYKREREIRYKKGEKTAFFVSRKIEVWV
jgi:hypothetical protein